MENIIGILIGLAIGALAGGALAWLAIKLRAGSADAALRANLDAASARAQAAEARAAELNQTIEQSRAQAEEDKLTAVRLETEFDASQRRFEELEQANSELSQAVEQTRAKSAESELQATRLQSEFDASQKRLAEVEQANSELNQAVEQTRAKSAESELQATRLQSEFDASQKRLTEIEQANAVLTSDAEDQQAQLIQTTADNADLKAKLDAANKRLAEQTDIEKTLLDQFKVMASESLSHNNDAFLKAADEKLGAIVQQANKDFSVSKDAVSELVKPLSEELKRIETARAKSQGSLSQQITALMENNNNLANQAQNLSTALKRPDVRGSWGETQLRRVVDLAGMTEHYDYEEQVSITTSDGKIERPDMVVYMPNERTIVVDAKTPMDAYLSAVESDADEDKQDALKRHARQVRERARSLSQKSYQQSFAKTPDFVVMFLPGEYLLSAALENDHELIDWAMQNKVVIATPNTLMALLKTVEMGWQEARIAQEAANVARLGQQLHERLVTFADHMAKMGKSLDSTVKNFNGGVRSLESRVLVSARRFNELGVQTGKEIPEQQEIETQPMELRSASFPALPAHTDAAGDD